MNPFMPHDAAGGAGAADETPPYTTQYGTNWSRIPITTRMGFVRPSVPAARAIAPPEPSDSPSYQILITSILWTQDGQAMAVYDSGGKSGVVRPGDVVDDWQVIEIWRDRVVVADRKTGQRQTMYITTKSAPAPAPARPGGGAGGAGGRTRPGRPGGAAAPGAGAAPGGGMPPPVR